MSKHRKATREVKPVLRTPAHEPRVSLSLLAFLSGVSALIFQVLWIKQLSLVVGAEVFAVTTGVSAFFAGLALGSLLLGRFADRIRKPILFYSLVEIGIAVAGTLATLLLAHSAAPFAYLNDRLGILAWILPMGLVAAPALLMGGTLPILVRFAATNTDAVPNRGGLLYAINTAGGIAGALLTPFVLLPQFGVTRCAVVAALFNLTAACIAWTWGRAAKARTLADQESDTDPIAPQARTALIVYALAGALALGYEVIWSQALIPFLSTRSFAFAIMLATYLAGIAIGSAVYARFAARVSDPWGVFAVLISAAGLLTFLLATGLGAWLLVLQTRAEELVLTLIGSGTAGMCARFAVAAISVVLLPTLLLGAAFPIALRLVVGEKQVGRDVGSVLALNTAGGIAGSLLTGFVLIPAFGLVRSLAALAFTAAAIGLFCVLRGANVQLATRRAVFVAAFAIVLFVVTTPRDRMAKTLTVARGGGDVVFYEEDAGGTVAVLEKGADETKFRRLYIQGVSNSGDSMPSLRYMRLQALLPLLVHREEPRSALVIGLGTGITAGALLQYPELERVVSVELLPGVVRAAPYFSGNYGATTDKRLEIRVNDGRRELLRDSSRYDVITLEAPPPSAAGVANLYSTDFYTLAAKRLASGGILAQWLPLPTQNEEDSRSLVRSFLDVFPYASLWTTELHETLLLGSFAPMELDAQKITQRFNKPAVAASLREVGIASPAALLATWMMDRAGLEAFAANSPAVTDDFPRIEYATWVRPGELTRTLPDLLTLSTDAPVKDADPALRAALDTERDSLSSFYAAGVAGYRGEKNLWAQAIGRALRTDAANPYYRWSVGGRP
jgi:spermidine synthase